MRDRKFLWKDDFGSGAIAHPSKIISPISRFCFPTCGILDYMPDTFLMTVSNAIFLG